MAQLQMDEGLLEHQVRKTSAASFPVDTVDERNPANQLIRSLSNYLEGFIHPRWYRISSINRMTTTTAENIRKS